MTGLAIALALLVLPLSLALAGGYLGAAVRRKRLLRRLVDRLVSPGERYGSQAGRVQSFRSSKVSRRRSLAEKEPY